MLSQWRRELPDNAADLSEGSSGKAAQKSQEEFDTRYREIGKRAVEHDFYHAGSRVVPDIAHGYFRVDLFRHPEYETTASAARHEPCPLYRQWREWLAEDRC